jgi:uncharacterized protein (TIGR02266 family)
MDSRYPGQAKFSEKSVSPVGRRGDARYRVDLEVGIASPHNFYGGLAENLSAGGVFVATHRTLPVGERVEVAIDVPDCPYIVRGVGEVRWTRGYCSDADVPPGIGVKFIHLEEGGAETIKRFLQDREPLIYEDE